MTPQTEGPARARAYKPGSRDNFPEGLGNATGAAHSSALCVGRRGDQKEAAEAGPGRGEREESPAGALPAQGALLPSF